MSKDEPVDPPGPANFESSPRKFKASQIKIERSHQQGRIRFSIRTKNSSSVESFPHKEDADDPKGSIRATLFSGHP
jgi:hypothetical protein